MPVLNDVLAGSLAQAVQVQQIIDALKGTPNKGAPIAITAVNDPTAYALSVQNDDPTNSRALLVLKADGTTLIAADATGVTLGAPVNLPAGSVNGGTALTNQSVTNAKLASDTARANLLTNGGFEIWQRGNGPFTANTAVTTDRWQINLAAGDTLSVSRDSTNAAGPSSQYCAACTYTRSTGATTLAQNSGTASEFLPAVKGRTITFSVLVRTSTANAVRLRINDGVTGVQNSAYHSGGGAYEQLSLTYAVAAGATSWNVQIQFDQSCTAYVDNAMLVVGAVPADYAPMHPADDLARCLRYYEVLGDGASSYPKITASAAGAHAIGIPLPYHVPKPVTPTTTKNGTWTVTNCNQPNISGAPGKDGTSMFVTATAAGAVDASAAAGCSITVESNP